MRCFRAFCARSTLLCFLLKKGVYWIVAKRLFQLVALLLLTQFSQGQFNSEKTRFYMPRVGFKDGTVLKNMKIRFVHDDSPSHKGIILHTADDRVYFHHYPYRPPAPIYKDYIPDDGTYQKRRVFAGYKSIEHFKPPITMSDFNPVHIPQCVPSRIPFIHFDKPTLNSLYKALSPYKDGIGQWPNETVWATGNALEFIKKAAWHNPKRFEMNTPAESQKWQNKLEIEMRLSWPKLYYGKWLK